MVRKNAYAKATCAHLVYDALTIEVKFPTFPQSLVLGTFRPLDTDNSQLTVARSASPGVMTGTFLRNLGSSAAAARLSSCWRMWE